MKKRIIITWEEENAGYEITPKGVPYIEVIGMLEFIKTLFMNSSPSLEKKKVEVEG